MQPLTVRAILVPGAWMGSWIWDSTVQRLSDRGFDAETMTLRGLEAGQPMSAVAAVRLEDHIQQLVAHISGQNTGPVVLVSHSYSAMPAALAADRLDSGKVCGLIHIGGFLPIHGRSLLDDWGDAAELRDQERADIAAAGNLWMPPEREMLDHVPDLTVEHRNFLAQGFTPHPGHTITDPARLSAPVATQPSTYVALSMHDDASAAWAQAPQVAQDASNWRKKYLRSGHWPMLSVPEATADLIAEEIRYYSPNTA